MSKPFDQLESTMSKLQSKSTEIRSLLTVFMLQIEEDELDKSEQECLEGLGNIIKKKIDELLYSEGLVLEAIKDLRKRDKLNIKDSDSSSFIL